MYDGTPYVAYTDYANGTKATVMEYNSGTDSWDPVGDKGFSDALAIYPSLSLSMYNGTPYVSYSDGLVLGKATVMKYITGDEGTSLYKWYRNGAEITGATGITYTPTIDDIGTTITFEVTRTNTL